MEQKRKFAVTCAIALACAVALSAISGCIYYEGPEYHYHEDWDFSGFALLVMMYYFLVIVLPIMLVAAVIGIIIWAIVRESK